jgi:hypothetical protein
LTKGIGVEVRRVRNHEVIHAADSQNRSGKVQRRFGIGRKEIAGFEGMFINAEMKLESALDIRNRATHRDQRAIGMERGDGEMVGLREGDERLIIGFGGAEAGGEFIRRRKGRPMVRLS